MTSPGAWTKASVAQALIEAFALMPAHPIWSTRAGFRAVDAGPAAAEPLNWARRYLEDDPDARKFLFAWARCRATKASWRAFCHEFGWVRSTAEAGRTRGAATIARRLNAAELRPRGASAGRENTPV